MNQGIMELLAEALAPELQRVQAKSYGIPAGGVGFKHDASGSPITVGYSHGPGGNLSYPGVDNRVFHTVVGNRGILGQLPVTASVFTNPTYAVVTGVQADVGGEKTEVCDTPPVAGLMKSGMLTSVFGRYERATRELELNRLGQRVNPADPMDLTLVGSPIHATGLFDTGVGNPSTPNDVLANEVSRKFWERNVSFHRLLSVQVWQGNPSNNTSGGGYKEMTGLDMLVTTGHRDAETGTVLPSVDSLVMNFGSQLILSSGTELVEAITYMVRSRKDLAERTGVMPVRWVLAMTQHAFFQITEVWPCAYLSYRCSFSEDQARVVINGDEQVRMRDNMRNGKFVLVDGERVDVVIDDGIAEDTATTNGALLSGQFSSSIYLIPMSVVGGQAVTFLETFDYNNPSARQAFGDDLVLSRVEGPFATTIKQTLWCVQWVSKIEPRLVLRTPWLAARLDRVAYSSGYEGSGGGHFRQPFPSDPYFVDGGLTSRPGPSLYNLWND